MRVTSSMYYENLYGTNNSKLNKQLFDVNKQIASGLKIQYASDDVGTFVETMRLDNELTAIGQIKKSTASGYKLSNQTDITMNEFTDTMTRMRTLMLQASNGAHSTSSLDAIAKELRGLEKNFKSLANTSINGQFLFSGTAVNVKPISDDGTYNGNDGVMQAFVGSNNYEKYNISGAEFFLGEEKLVKREITTNVANANLLGGDTLNANSQLRDLMGDVNSTTNTDYFYLRGTRSDGTTFKDKVTLSDTAKVQDLLDKIEVNYGVNTVNVSMNDAGQIVVADKQSGSSKLDFHMVGAVDFSGGAAANVTDIDALDIAGADTYPPSGNLFVKEFMKSGLNSATGAASNIEGLIYDRAEFTKQGATLSSNHAQVLKKSHIVQEVGQEIDTIGAAEQNSFAVDSTLLSEVADISKGTASTADDTLSGTQFVLSGKNVSGAAFTAQIDLSATSTFSLDGGVTNYNIYNVDGTVVDADKMTYRQMMDVVNIITTGNLPDGAYGNTQTEYENKIVASNLMGDTSLSYDGKIEFKDLSNALTKASISIYDANSNDFSNDPSVMTFNANNALTVRDPKTDFFKEIDEIITAVENHKFYPETSSGVLRNVGMENSIAKIDDLQDHINRTQAVAGAQSNTLSVAQERTAILEVSTMTLRSSTIDTDLAESSLRLSQLTLNYQAMLSTVGKVSQLSLVNYL